jgi:glycosyltransferase involved in cell wall biosynthesis
MKLLFVQEAVYLEYNGELYSSRINYETYWNRFLPHFDTVTVVARAKKVQTLPAGYFRSTGDKVRFVSLNYYNGPIEFYKQRKFLLKKINHATANHSVFVLRIPGPIGALTYKILEKKKLKYVVEVVGDPFEVANSLPLFFPLKFIYKIFGYYEMKKIVGNAAAAIYVTEHFLQSRYPTARHALEATASNVIIKDEYLLSDTSKRKRKIASLQTRLHNMNAERIKIGTVGMLYSIKSPLEIVKAARLMINAGLNIEVNFVGEGPLLNDIQKLAKQLNIEDRIYCIGILPAGPAVFNFLDTLDLYIQFSKTEGLPRAMVEAMARGCPVIASKVGGIPELICKDLLVSSGDYNALFKKVLSFLNDTSSIEKAIDDNILTARKFLDTELTAKRFNFYSKVYNMYKKNEKHNYV